MVELLNLSILNLPCQKYRNQLDLQIPSEGLTSMSYPALKEEHPSTKFYIDLIIFHNYSHDLGIMQLFLSHF